MSQLTSSHQAKLAPLIKYMEGLTERPALEDVTQRLEELEISCDELGQHVEFHNNCYKRNLIFENDQVQLFCLCWKSGQHSPIHDHANSICAVKVISGIASETVFENTPSGYLKAVSTTDYSDGVVGSQDDDIHQITNHQGAAENLVTLHCYAPPIKRMNTYSLDSKYSQIYEPIDEQQRNNSGT